MEQPMYTGRSSSKASEMATTVLIRKSLVRRYSLSHHGTPVGGSDLP